MKMSVALDPATALPTAAARALFKTNLVFVHDNIDQYDVTADGRFLFVLPVGGGDPGEIVVIVNWQSAPTK